MVGFKSLQSRIKRQEHQAKIYHGRLDEIANDISESQKVQVSFIWCSRKTQFCYLFQRTKQNSRKIHADVAFAVCICNLVIQGHPKQTGVFKLARIF